jgi:hypothetical protein
MYIQVTINLAEGDEWTEDVNTSAERFLATAGGDTAKGDICNVNVQPPAIVGVAAPPPPDPTIVAQVEAQEAAR